MNESSFIVYLSFYYCFKYSYVSIVTEQIMFEIWRGKSFSKFNDTYKQIVFKIILEKKGIL